MSASIDQATIAAAIDALEQIEPGRVRQRPTRVQETSGSWLAFFSRQGERAPAYCLKARKPVRAIRATERDAEQLATTVEYDMLARVHEYFSRFPEFSNSVARPVQLLADHDAILTAYVEGQPLKGRLPWWGNSINKQNLSDLRTVSAKCGAWLRLLHEMERPPWLPSLHHGSDHWERTMVDAAAALPAPLRRYLPLNYLLSRVRQLSSDSAHLAVGHGDFQPGNILVSGSDIVIFDLGTAGFRTVEDDLAFFIVLMFAQKERITFGHPQGTPYFIRDLCDTFLAAYGLSPSEAWRRIMPLLAVKFVERLVQMSDTIGRMPKPVRPFLIRRLAVWVTAELPLLVESMTTSAAERTAKMWRAVD